MTTVQSMPPHTASKQGKILLVDDNIAFIDSIKDVLEDEGYHVVTADSGEAALKRTQDQPFDLVLMDIKMPGMNGVESFIRMKQMDPDVRVILFTAYALDELIQQAHDHGVLAVLKKPLEMDVLIKAVEEASCCLKGGCILIADDDKALCENLYDTLSESGYNVVMAHGAEAVIKAAAREQYDVLLLDMKLPERNGLEVYRQVKKMQPSLITIMMTGYADEMRELIRQAIQESIYTLLPKPIDMNQLLNLLEKAIEERTRNNIKKPKTEY